MRPRVIMVLAVATIVLGGVLLVPAAYARLAGDAKPGDGGSAAPALTGIVPTAPPPPTLVAGPVTVPKINGFFSWALLDRKSGKISGAKNMTATNSTESMIKVWIVSDYLRRLGDKPPPASFKKMASTAIRDSNDDSANALYKAVGGTATLSRLVKTCGLTETKPVIPPGESTIWWSYTKMSARDAVRMGECVKDGRAAGQKWTAWVLDEMSKVEGTTAKKDQKAREGGGRWGIIDGLPTEILAQGPVSIKNGWTLINADGKWHVNCLAVNDNWVLSVLLRYPGKSGLNYGANVCASVATQLVAPQPGAVLKVPQPLGKQDKPAGGNTL